MADIESVGELADKADNLVAAASIPGVPERIHVECLVAGLREMSTTLKGYYREFTGKNPWE